MDYYDYLHDSLIGWLRPHLSLFIDPLWVAASMPWISIIVYSIMDGYAHTTHIYHVSETLVVLHSAGFPMAVFSVGMFS